MSAFLWSMCNIIAMFYKSCKVVRIFPPLEANKTHLLVCQLVYFIVMLYLLLCSSHVAGMIGLINKTKGLRFCNDSGFLELYNDPQVKLTAINSQSFHSKYP